MSPRPITAARDPRRRRAGLRAAVLAALALLITPATAQANPGASGPAAAAGPPLAVQVAKLTGGDSINETASQYQVMATDLGAMWDNGRGQVLMAFGDTYGEGWDGSGSGPTTADWRCNVLARSSDTDLSDGMTFDDMVVDEPGHAKQLLDCAKDPQEEHGEHTVIPNSGISVGDRQYLHYFSLSYWGPWNTNYSGIAYSDDNGETWTKSDVRWDNTPQWDRSFQIATFAKAGGYVYLFGTVNDRVGALNLARVPEGKVLDQDAYRYWDGRRWQRDEAAAVPVVTAPSGELSVSYNAYLGRWIMMHPDRYRSALVMREAESPAGPWSGERVIVRGGSGQEYPGSYAPFIHPSSATSDSPDLYFGMTLWGPYNVFLMKTTLDRDVDTANLLSAPGFEDQLTGATSPWTISGRGSVLSGAASAHTGERYGDVRGARGWNQLVQTLAVRPHEDYRLTAWVRSGARTKQGLLGVRDRDGTIKETTFTELAGYTEVTVDFRSGDRSEIEAFAGFWGTGVDTSVQVDDVRLSLR
jgi:hypothetical protein